MPQLVGRSMKSKLDKELDAVGLTDLCGFIYPSGHNSNPVFTRQIINLLQPYKALIKRLTIGLVLSVLLNVWALWGIYGN